ncbi:MAG: branched-chain amino acid ABC transporter permease, partial [Syntrophorhabdales bacterium]
SNVLILSSMYILVALGFAFLFNMLGLLNLAHGAIYMIGAYIAFILVAGLGLSLWVAMVLATLVVALLGIFLEKVCFRPFVGDFNRSVMICVALTVLFQTIVNIMAGAKSLALPPIAQGVLRVGPVSSNYERIVTFAIGAVLLVAFVVFVNKTKWGQQMQAIAQNTDGASLQGISVHKISALASALGCGLAALAGCLMGALLGIGPFMGDSMLVKALMLVILAGVGSVGGIFLAGLLMGALNAVLPLVTNGAASEAAAVAVVVILLLIRPKGFFGHEA